MGGVISSKATLRSPYRALEPQERLLAVFRAQRQLGGALAALEACADALPEEPLEQLREMDRRLSARIQALGTGGSRHLVRQRPSAPRRVRARPAGQDPAPLQRDRPAAPAGEPAPDPAEPPPPAAAPDSARPQQPDLAGGQAAQPPQAPAPAQPPAAPLAELCRDYEPAPRPMPGPCVAPPPGWRAAPAVPLPDPLLLGTSGPTPQYGTLGRLRPGRQRVGLSLNEPFCLSTFSVPGGGKSYLLASVLEMALAPLPGLSRLVRPLCGIAFHCHGSLGYEPELLAAVQPNQHPREALDLMEGYGTLPRGLADVVLLVPPAQVRAMRQRHPHLRVFPILFSPDELGSDGWKVLLGLNDEGDERLHARLLRQALGTLRQGLSLPALQALVGSQQLPEAARRALELRLRLVQPYLAEGAPIRRLLRPGRLLLIDVRDAWVPRSEALSLVALLTSVLGRRDEGRDFPLLLCFDEAHRYTGDRAMRAELERLVRERRHLDASVILSSQDPLSLPPTLLALSDILAIGQVQSEEWLQRVARANAALRFLRPAHTARLGRGRMILWSQRQHVEGIEPSELLPAHVVDLRPLCAH
ncbi:MAG: hypothetical protein RMK29_08630, partial [Myxococcales bacterium]|nr:hypothetical protein [Myxococcales bacterium]